MLSIVAVDTRNKCVTTAALHAQQFVPVPTTSTRWGCQHRRYARLPVWALSFPNRPSREEEILDYLPPPLHLLPLPHNFPARPLSTPPLLLHSTSPPSLRSSRHRSLLPSSLNRPTWLPFVQSSLNCARPLPGHFVLLPLLPLLSFLPRLPRSLNPPHLHRHRIARLCFTLVERLQRRTPSTL